MEFIKVGICLRGIYVQITLVFHAFKFETVLGH